MDTNRIGEETDNVLDNQSDIDKILDQYLEMTYQKNLKFDHLFKNKFACELSQVAIPMKLVDSFLKNEISYNDLILKKSLLGQKTLITGEEGSGKKFLAQYITLKSIEKNIAIPVVIDADSFHSQLTFEEFILKQFNLKNDDQLKKQLFNILNSPKTYFIIYNIDEVVGEGLKKAKEELIDFLKFFKKSTCVFLSENDNLKTIVEFAESFNICKTNLTDTKNLLRKYDASFNLNISGTLIKYLSKESSFFEKLIISPLYVYAMYFSFLIVQKMKTSSELERITNFKLTIQKILSRSVEDKIKEKKEIVFNNHRTDNLECIKPIIKSEKGDLIIHPPFGHLGSVLWFTHVPRIAKESGRFKRVLISNNIIYNNDEYKYLFWDLNPYVDGYCDETNFKSYDKCSKNINDNNNILCSILHMYDLNTEDTFYSPEIYYKPKYIKELEGKVLFDPNCISNSRFNLEDYFLIQKFFKNNNVFPYYQMRIRKENPNPAFDAHKRIPVSFFQKTIHTETLRDFCDVLYSVGDVYCLLTGTEALASAIGKPVNVLMGEDVNIKSSINNAYFNLKNLENY